MATSELSLSRQLRQGFVFLTPTPTPPPPIPYSVPGLLKRAIVDYRSLLATRCLLLLSTLARSLSSAPLHSPLKLFASRCIFIFVLSFHVSIFLRRLRRQKQALRWPLSRVVRRGQTLRGSLRRSPSTKVGGVVDVGVIYYAVFSSSA